MRPRLRGGLRRFLSAASVRLRRRVRPALPAVKGRTLNVISVRPPDPRFREVLFILREDCFSGEELNRQALLLQARQAAGDYVASLLPPARRRFSPLPYLLLPAAGALTALLLMKLL